MDSTTAKYDRTRNLVLIHGKEYTVKRQRGRYYIHAENKQITVTDIVLRKEENDCVFDYIFGEGFRDFPCVAMDYWIYRWRLGNKISIQQYKEKYLV